MHILIGLAMGVALLYFWLIGNWFARVLVFLLLGTIGFTIGALSLPDQQHTNALGVILLGLIVAAPAWPLAGLPAYYWRYRATALDRRVKHVLRVLGAGMPPLPDKH